MLIYRECVLVKTEYEYTFRLIVVNCYIKDKRKKIKQSGKILNYINNKLEYIYF